MKKDITLREHLSIIGKSTSKKKIAAVTNNLKKARIARWGKVDKNFTQLPTVKHV